MSEERNDGGPAFPVKGGMLFYYPKELEEQLRGVEEGVRASFDGMTLRDWFAGQVVIGHFHIDPAQQASYAQTAYQMADALLAARARGGGQA